MAKVVEWMRQLARRVRGPGTPAETHPFDVAHSVETSGLYYSDKLPTGHAHDPHSEGYYATAPSLFHGVLAQWLTTLPPGRRMTDYAFIDLGSGKGRVVLLATLYPFTSVLGIELNRHLVRTARRNLRKWMRSGPAGDGAARRIECRNVFIDCGDVLGIELPAGPVVLFLFNSFGKEVLRPLLEKLADAALCRTAPIDLIYSHPDQDQLVAGIPGMELLRYVEVPFSEEDVSADVFDVSSDFCSIYRLAGARP